MDDVNRRMVRAWAQAASHLYKTMKPEINKMLRDAFQDGDGTIAIHIKPNGKIGTKAISRMKAKRAGK